MIAKGMRCKRARTNAGKNNVAFDMIEIPAIAADTQPQADTLQH